MKKQNFLYVFDDNYAPYAGISILSLLSNAKSDADITIFCGGMNVSEGNINKIENTVKSRGQHVKWLDKSVAYCASTIVLVAIGIFVCREILLGLKNKDSEGLYLPFGPAMVIAGLLTFFMLNI